VKTLEHSGPESQADVFRQLIGTVARTEHADDFTRASVIDYTGDLERCYRFHFTSVALPFPSLKRTASSLKRESDPSGSHPERAAR
jgi:hypothetical protein